MATGWTKRDPARILVTGCSSGIGRALCAELHDRGHRVIATARDTSALAALPAHAHLELDVTDAASIADAAAAAGPVDVLISNAAELTLMTRPRRLVRIAGKNAWHTRSMPHTFVSKTR